MYEKNKAAKLEEEAKAERRAEQRRSWSTSKARSSTYPDPSRSAPRLVEYGDNPMFPAADYYGRPASQQEYYSEVIESGRRPRRGGHGSRSRTARTATVTAHQPPLDAARVATDDIAIKRIEAGVGPEISPRLVLPLWSTDSLSARASWS
jgi:hypothetical protein